LSSTYEAPCGGVVHRGVDQCVPDHASRTCHESNKCDAFHEPSHCARRSECQDSRQPPRCWSCRSCGGRAFHGSFRRDGQGWRAFILALIKPLLVKPLLVKPLLVALFEFSQHLDLVVALLGASELQPITIVVAFAILILVAPLKVWPLALLVGFTELRCFLVAPLKVWPLAVAPLPLLIKLGLAGGGRGGHLPPTHSHSHGLLRCASHNLLRAGAGARRG